MTEEKKRSDFDLREEALRLVDDSLADTGAAMAKVGVGALDEALRYVHATWDRLVKTKKLLAAMRCPPVVAEPAASPVPAPALCTHPMPMTASGCGRPAVTHEPGKPRCRLHARVDCWWFGVRWSGTGTRVAAHSAPFPAATQEDAIRQTDARGLHLVGPWETQREACEELDRKLALAGEAPSAAASAAAFDAEKFATALMKTLNALAQCDSPSDEHDRQAARAVERVATAVETAAKAAKGG